MMARFSLVKQVVVLVLAQLCCTVLADNLLTLDSWVQISTPLDPPTARESHTAVYNLVNNSMVVFGGRDTSKCYNDVSFYSLLTGLWSASAKVGGVAPAARYGHSAGATGKNLMVIFGGRNGTSYFNDVAFFDLLGNKWVAVNTTGTPPSPRAFHSAVVDHYQHVMYVYGGTDGENTYSDIYAFDLDAKAWSTVVPTNGSAIARAYHSATVSDLGVMVVFGGLGTGSAGLSDVSCFSTRTLAWFTCLSDPSPAPSVRYGHSAVNSPLQRMVVFGGKNAGGNAVNDVWAFDMNLFKWYSITPGGLAIDARAYHTAVATPFGTMIIFAGVNSGGSLDNVFGLYNLASTVIRSAYDGAVLVVILTLLGTILLALCFAMDYMQEQSEIEKEEAIIKAKQEQALLLPKLPAIPKALHIPLGPRAQKFFDEFKTSLDPLQDPPQ